MTWSGNCVAPDDSAIFPREAQEYRDRLKTLWPWDWRPAIGEQHNGMARSENRRGKREGHEERPRP
jgi:hypothetical protein